MARPRTLPEDNREMEVLLRYFTQQEVADRFGVTNQAVSKAVRERKLSVPRRRPSYRLPWPIREEHADDYARRMLRNYLKAKSGAVLSPKDARMLARFCEKLDRDDRVVQYDPDHPRGPWLYLPRRHGIDTDYVRNPEVP